MAQLAILLMLFLSVQCIFAASVPVRERNGQRMARGLPPLPPRWKPTGTHAYLWAPSLSISITVHVVEQSQKQARRDCLHQRVAVLTDYFGASRTLAHPQLYPRLVIHFFRF
ncbi:hypothetical protein DFH08DRAFT_1088909 [Mycena albidolilacea]|uniref:Secreted protein n=1 Tax=Mycena albidolilacea TaxID=1033008 RepID=A0AAD7EA88_9AGAR|nr:hypothetical protein DFH08DRAFT_1088909 [Mycena albidolilacea]